jgi:hypothetical protein
VALSGSAHSRRSSERFASLAKRQALRPAAFVRRFRLDSELAAGADPRSRPTLALRADQLVHRHYRRRLAASVERLVREADADRGYWFSAAIPFLHDQVAEARGTLLAIVEALRAPESIQPRGVAMVAQLLMDPATSPLYVASVRGALQLKAHAALECMLGDREAWFEVGPDGHR